MEFNLVDNGDSCLLTQNNCSSSNAFTIPTPKETLVAAIVAILNNPEQKEIIIAEQAVMVEKQVSAGIYIHVGSARFNVPWLHIFSLVAA